MDTAILSGYATASYLLVIEPHVSLQAEILHLKKQFAERYDCPGAATGKPNITLLRFEQFEMIEPKIVRRLELLIRSHESFVVELNGFGSLPTHSIYIETATKNPVLQLARALRPLQQLMKIDKERKPHFISDPHIVVARRLLPWQYEKGWLEMSHSHFSGRFTVNQVVLLRKRENEKMYTTVKRFQLLAEKETVTQGELFA